MILTKPQAEAIYSAWGALRAVGGRNHVHIPQGTPGTYIHVKEYEAGTIMVWFGNTLGHPIGSSEEYPSMNAFGLAYCVGV